MHNFSLLNLVIEKTNTNVLHWICKNNYRSVLEYFIENHVPFTGQSSSPDKNGYLPLYYALTYHSDLEINKSDNQFILRMLLSIENYANSTLFVNVTDDSCDWDLVNPIEIAHNNGKQEAVNLLFEQDSDIDMLPDTEKKRLLSMKRPQEFKNEDLIKSLRA